MMRMIQLNVRGMFKMKDEENFRISWRSEDDLGLGTPAYPQHLKSDTTLKKFRPKSSKTGMI